MLTNIPLDDCDPKGKEEEESPDDIAWLKAYKRLMGQSYQLLYNLLVSNDWEHIPPPDASETVTLHQKASANGFFTLKAEGIIHGRIERIMYLNKDHNKETRLKWDNQDGVTDIELLETHKAPEGDLQVVRSVVELPTFMKRISLGIMSHTKTSDDTQTLVFRTTVNPRFPVPADCVAVDAFSGVMIRDLKDGRCKIVIVTYVNPGGWIPPAVVALYKEKLRKRVHHLEQVVKDWNLYYGKKDTKK